MPSTYTQNLGLEKPATGEQAGTWGNTANTTYDSLDAASDGNTQIPLAMSPFTLVTNNGGGPSQGLNKVIFWNGPTTGNSTVQVQPNTAQKLYFMNNLTTGGFTITFTQGSGGSYTLQPGYSGMVFCDGAGSNASCGAAFDNPQFSSLLVTGNATIQGQLLYTAPQTFTQPVTFSATVALNGGTTVNVPGFANSPGDMYYRSATGTLAPIPIGTTGQVLQVVGAGVIAWATAQLALGATIVNSVANCIYYSNPSNVFAQSTVFVYNQGLGVGIGTGTPQTTLHVLGPSGAPQSTYGSLVVSGGDQAHSLRLGYSLAGDYAWIQGVEDGVTEKPLVLNGGGSYVGISTVSPNTALEVAGIIRCSGAGNYYESSSGNAFGRLFAATSASDGYNHFFVSDNFFSYDGETGVLDNGAMNAAAMEVETSASGVYSSINFWFGGPGVVPARQIYMGCGSISGEIGIGVEGPIYQLQLYMDSAAKPNSSAWTVPSDVRLKQNTAPMTDDSLAIIAALRWIRYEYNGLGQILAGTKGVGLEAQELDMVLPEAVRRTAGRLEQGDLTTTDILGIDYHHVLVHAARAIRQLSERVRELEERP